MCTNGKVIGLVLLMLCVVLGKAAVARAVTHRIKATAGAGGHVDPYGAISVNGGEDVTFTIVPNADHVISNIRVNDISVGAASSYTIYRAKQNCNLEISFLPKTNGTAETIYVDNSLTRDCKSGQYSIVKRDSS